MNLVNFLVNFNFQIYLYLSLSTQIKFISFVTLVHYLHEIIIS